MQTMPLSVFIENTFQVELEEDELNFQTEQELNKIIRPKLLKHLQELIDNPEKILVNASSD